MQRISPPLVSYFCVQPLYFIVSFSRQFHIFPFFLLSLLSSSFRFSKIGAPPSQHHRNRFSRHVYPTDSTLCSLNTCLQFLHAWSPWSNCICVHFFDFHKSTIPRLIASTFFAADLLVAYFQRVIALSEARLWFFSLSLPRREYCPFFTLFIFLSPLSAFRIVCLVWDFKFPLRNYAVYEFGFRFSSCVFSCSVVAAKSPSNHAVCVGSTACIYFFFYK